MRGLVISPEYERVNTRTTILKDSQIKPIPLRQYLLYWDQLDFPKNSNVYIDGSVEVDYLENVGVLKRTLIDKDLSSGDLGMFLSELQIEALKINNKSDNGKWALAQPNDFLAFNTNSGVMTRNLEIELYQSIPIPTPEVSLDDILIFKEKRKDDLLEFRELMDNFYFKLIDSADSEREMDSYVSKVQRKIFEIDRVMNESKISKFRGSMKIEFNVNKIFKNTLIGAVGGMQFGFPELGSTIGFASSVINVKSEMTLKPKEIPDELKSYAYLYYTKKELR